jgi:hypothetical protein
MIDAPRPFAVIRGYDDLIAAARARKAALGISFETLDAVSGVQSGYKREGVGPWALEGNGRHVLRRHHRRARDQAAGRRGRGSDGHSSGPAGKAAVRPAAAANREPLRFNRTGTIVRLSLRGIHLWARVERTI